MFKRARIEEPQVPAEQEVQLEQEQETTQLDRTASLIQRIQHNTGVTPLIFGSTSFRDMSTQEVIEACVEIDKNPNIDKIVVEAEVSLRGAARIVDEFLKHENAREVEFNMMLKATNSSQRRILEAKEKCEEKVDAHNLKQTVPSKKKYAIFE